MLRIHDVIRAFARFELMDEARLVLAHRALLTASGRYLPVSAVFPNLAAWWSMAAPSAYLKTHLVYHLVEAGWTVEAEALVLSPQWGVARRDWDGLNAVAADLIMYGSGRAQGLRRELLRAAPILRPTSPRHSLQAILLSRVVGLRTDAFPLQGTYFTNRWPLPDLNAVTLLARLRGPGPVAI